MLTAAVATREAHDGLRFSHPPALNPFRQPLERMLLAGLKGGLGLHWMGNFMLAGIVSGPVDRA
jgi:hypothetical protein